MRIEHLEISNFRKLLAVRVDLAEKITLFVGANNSGKTSAMLALRRFLIKRGSVFQTHDITLCHWSAINALGQAWLEARGTDRAPNLNAEAWAPFMPTLDLWLKVESDELHHVSKLLPRLDWAEGILGVRLRLEPKDVEALHKEFLQSISDAEAMKAAAKMEIDDEVARTGVPKDPPKLTLWPITMMDFLSRRLNHHFAVRSYPLDPSKLVEPKKAVARPQELAPGSAAIEGDPLTRLIRVNEINAQRGFGEMRVADEDGEATYQPGGHRLSDQLRAYYKKHLDPSNRPDPSDLGALQAIEAAQDAFDGRLAESFKAAFEEVEGLGYPGVTDPRPHISTRVRATDGLNHEAAVSFQIDVMKVEDEIAPVLRLPEDNNGLGYQNLISMIFRLMSFRDAWMRVGKASKTLEEVDFEPLHLVLVEEPEAHLHAQVQQVFIKKAYDVLRAHTDLGKTTLLQTQLIVSTHSSHVAHETSYSCLRYFRRLPAGMENVSVPVSVVINLTNVFGEENETSRFVTRYLRGQHADFFFADAVILVEGSAERMMLPNFIRRNYPRVNQGYITLLEVGGSHAHKLRPLLDLLGLTTLVITDLDTQKGTVAVQPKTGAGQVTNNDTLKAWLPQKSAVDDLLEPTLEKVIKHDPLHEVRVAYQLPVQVTWPVGATGQQTALPYTFEDALAFENLAFFSTLAGAGLVAKFREAINATNDVTAIGAALFKDLRTGSKAEFVLNVLGAEGFDNLVVPIYIAEGLTWLESQLSKKQVEFLSTEAGMAE